MIPNGVRHTLFPILAAFIWGTAFVFQSMCTDYIGPMTFNFLRAAVAAVVLLIIIFVFEKFTKNKPVKTAGEKRADKKNLLIGSICCGVFLTVASNFQQLGIADTSAGKTAFITALYVVIVPVLGLFLKKKVPVNVWIGVATAVVGLYCLCIKGDFTIATSDLYVVACAVVFAVHILVIDHFTNLVDGIKLSCAQFIVVMILSGAGAFIFESPELKPILQCLLPVLYVGVFSSGVAYTLQILAQKDANPTVVTILLSLESVFGTLAGAIILKETMSVKEYIGCVLMFAAVILAQLPERKKQLK